MDKKQKYGLMLFCALGICLMIGMGMYMKREACVKKVDGFDADYTYYDRSLSARDFAQFGYESTYEEIMECVGMPNGVIGSGIIRPYYELEDGRFVICVGWDKINYIFIANHECLEDYLLPQQGSWKLQNNQK